MPDTYVQSGPATTVGPANMQRPRPGLSGMVKPGPDSSIYPQPSATPNMGAGYNPLDTSQGIFNQQHVDGALSGYPKLRPLTPEEVQKIANNYLDECVDFRDSELQATRTKIDKYYRGETDLPVVEGRSKVIVTKVRDGIKSVVPSLARIFTQTDKVAEFWSDDEEDQAICKDATLYCNNVFWKYGGYRALITASTDALKSKVGVIKVEIENKTYVSHQNYNAQAVEQSGMELPNVTEANSEEMVNTNKTVRKCWRFTPVPPENFIIHPTAITIEDAVCCSHEREESISDLVEMGYDFDELKDIPAVGEPVNYEDQQRKGFIRRAEVGSSPAIDPTARVLLFNEAYVRVDSDGDGIAELRRLCLIGPQRKLFSDEPVNWAPFASFSAELQPHMFYPICLAEDLVQDQDASTALLRSIIDNTALVNNPRTVLNERMVNLEDAKNGKLGAIIRAKEMGMIEELVTPFVAGQTLPVLEHLDNVSEARSGITKLSQGTDPDVLQSTTQVAAQNAVANADARIEMMARNIAETGVKSLFECIMRTAIYYVNDSVSIQLPDGFKTVNPNMWHQYLNIKVNVGLGSGRIDEKKQVFMTLLPVAQQLIEKLGVANPICNWNNAREMLKVLLRLNGVHDYQTYFPYVNPQLLQQIDQQSRQQSQQQQQVQMQAMQAQNQAAIDFVKVEAQKNQMKFESDQQKMQAKYDADIKKLQMQIQELVTKTRLDMTATLLEDDRIRDKNDMDFAIDSKKVGLEKEKIAVTRAQVEAQRQQQQETVQ